MPGTPSLEVFKHDRRAHHDPIELSTVMEMVYRILQFGSQWPHVATEGLKCEFRQPFEASDYSREEHSSKAGAGKLLLRRARQEIFLALRAA